MAPHSAPSAPTPSLTLSDVHSLLSIITIRLGERNFIKWRFQFLVALTGNGFFGYYDGSEVPPPRYVLSINGGVTIEETAAYKAWKQTDMALLSLLIATLNEDIVDVIIGCKSSSQAWLALQDRFSAVSRVSIMQLKTKLQTLRKGAESIEKYLQRVKNARDQLLSVGVAITDEDIVIVILNGLPDEYSTICTVIEGRENYISLRDLRFQLLAAERRIEGSFSSLSNMSAMIARGDGSRNGSREGNSRDWDSKSGDNKSKDSKFSGSDAECPVCGKKGHTVDTCFRVHKCQICGKHGHLSNTCYQNLDYKVQQVPQQVSQPSYRPSNNNGPSPKRQICLKKGHTAANCFYRTDVPAGHPSLSIPTCQICGLKGHVALNCSHRTNFSYQGSDPPPSLTALTTQSHGIFQQTGQGSQGGYLVTNSSHNSSFPGGFHPSNGASSSSSGVNDIFRNSHNCADDGEGLNTDGLENNFHNIGDEPIFQNAAGTSSGAVNSGVVPSFGEGLNSKPIFLNVAGTSNGEINSATTGRELVSGGSADLTTVLDQNSLNALQFGGITRVKNGIVKPKTFEDLYCYSAIAQQQLYSEFPFSRVQRNDLKLQYVPTNDQQLIF